MLKICFVFRWRKLSIASEDVWARHGIEMFVFLQFMLFKNNNVLVNNSHGFILM